MLLVGRHVTTDAAGAGYRFSSARAQSGANAPRANHAHKPRTSRGQLDHFVGVEHGPSVDGGEQAPR